jgi:hypothetical protein
VADAPGDEPVAGDADAAASLAEVISRARSRVAGSSTHISVADILAAADRTAGDGPTAGNGTSSERR